MDWLICVRRIHPLLNMYTLYTAVSASLKCERSLGYFMPTSTPKPAYIVVSWPAKRCPSAWTVLWSGVNDVDDFRVRFCPGGGPFVL